MSPNNKVAMKLRIWHIPQVPCPAFRVEIPLAEDTKMVEEAIRLLQVLSSYDLFQYENKIKPDYANAQGLEFLDSDGTWCEWHDEEDRDISDVLRELRYAQQVPELQVPHCGCVRTWAEGQACVHDKAKANSSAVLLLKNIIAAEDAKAATELLRAHVPEGSDASEEQVYERRDTLRDVLFLSDPGQLREDKVKALIEYTNSVLAAPHAKTAYGLRVARDSLRVRSVRAFSLDVSMSPGLWPQDKKEP